MSVGEAVSIGLANTQGLKLSIRVVGEGAIRVQRDQTATGGGKAACSDRQGVPVHITVRAAAVVGQHVAVHRAVLVGDHSIVRRHRRIIHPIDRDGRGGRIGTAVTVADGIAEAVTGAVAHRQNLKLPVGVVVKGTVGIQRQQRAAGQGDLGADIQRVTVDIGDNQRITF